MNAVTIRNAKDRIITFQSTSEIPAPISVYTDIALFIYCVFFFLLFLVWPLLPTHCKCRILLLVMIQWYKRVRTYTHTHTHTHTNTYTDKYIHTHTHKHIHRQIHTHTHTHTNTYSHKHINTYTHKHINTYTHKHKHTHTHTNTYTHTQTHVLYFSSGLLPTHRTDVYLKTHNTHKNKHPCPLRDSNLLYLQLSVI